MSEDLRLGLITSLNSDFDYKEFNLNLNFVHTLISISYLYLILKYFCSAFYYFK